MWCGWRNFHFGTKRQNDVSSSDKELDSDFENYEGEEGAPRLLQLMMGRGESSTSR